MVQGGNSDAEQASIPSVAVLLPDYMQDRVPGGVHRSAYGEVRRDEVEAGLGLLGQVIDNNTH